MPKYSNIPVLIVPLLFLVMAPSVQAQQWSWPEKSENLKVLPDSTTAQELSNVMRSFTRALGVRCYHCHVGEPGQSLSEFDFASDTKANKLKARVMMKLVRASNDDYISTFNSLENEPSERLAVTCVTCHRGRPRPEMLEDVLVATAQRDSVEAAVAEYRDLREAYYGGFSFDFRPGRITDAATRLSQSGNHEGAVTLMALEHEVNGKSMRSLISLAQIHSAGEKPTEARAALEEALELAPDDRAKSRIQRMIEELESSEE